MTKKTAATTKAATGFYTRQEVADMLRVSVEKIAALMRDGGFPQPLRLGHRTMRFYRAEVDSWLAAQR